MGVLNITRWPAVAVFLLAGVAVLASAFSAVNLFTYAMANLAFLRRAGWDAVANGALWQVAELSAWGALSFALWMVFKISESELTRRYQAWAGRDQGERSRR